MAPDYSQLEVRVFASLAKDDKLAQAYKDDLDIHQYVASVMYKLPFDKVAKYQRSYAKTVVFGILYGKGVPNLAKELKISVPDAQAIFDLLLEAFPAVKAYIENTKQTLHTFGYARSAFGRYRFLSDAKLPASDNRNKWKIAEAERAGVNHTIQSSASDLMFTSIIQLDNATYFKNMESGSIGSVHDSLQFDSHPREILDSYYLIKEQCEDRLQTYDWVNGVPYKMDIDMGMGWGTAMGTSVIDKTPDYLKVKVSGRKYGMDSLLWCCERNDYYKFDVLGDVEHKEWTSDDDDADRLYKGALNLGDKVKFIMTLERK
jgi:DNA polymerase-1